MTLKFELVNGYGVLVDEKAEIKEGDYKYCPFDDLNKIHVQEGDYHDKNEYRILFAEKELGLDVPVFEWMDFEVEKLAIKKYGDKDYASHSRYFFIQGYKSNPAKYTEEDLRKAIAMSKMASTHDGLIDMDSWISNGYEGAIPAYSEDEIIESLQKHPKYVVMENNTVKELIW